MPDPKPSPTIPPETPPPEEPKPKPKPGFRLVALVLALLAGFAAQAKANGGAAALRFRSSFSYAPQAAFVPSYAPAFAPACIPLPAPAPIYCAPQVPLPAPCAPHILSAPAYGFGASFGTYAASNFALRAQLGARAFVPRFSVGFGVGAGVRQRDVVRQRQKSVLFR
jgi:hypothetical protein